MQMIAQAAAKTAGFEPAPTEFAAPPPRKQEELTTVKVDADHGVPLIERHPLERRVALRTGVGDHDVQGPELADRRWANIAATSSSRLTSAFTAVTSAAAQRDDLVPTTAWASTGSLT